MKAIFLGWMILWLTMGCGDPEPRRPLVVHTGTFFDNSVARTRQLLAQEQAQLQELIRLDSLHTYQASPHGFWYYYHPTQVSLANGSFPRENDAVQLICTIRTLSNDTLYPHQEINFTMYRNAPFTALNEAVKLMKKGQTATFLFPSSIAYGYKGDGDRIGGNTPFIGTFFLQEIVQAPENNTHH